MVLGGQRAVRRRRAVDQDGRHACERRAPAVTLGVTHIRRLWTCCRSDDAGRANAAGCGRRYAGAGGAVHPPLSWRDRSVSPARRRPTDCPLARAVAGGAGGSGAPPSRFHRPPRPPRCRLCLGVGFQMPRRPQPGGIRILCARSGLNSHKPRRQLNTALKRALHWPLPSLICRSLPATIPAAGD
jgi:hypothetical protein